MPQGCGPGCYTPAVISAATTNVELLGAVGLAGVLALSVPALRKPLRLDAKQDTP